MTVMTALLVGLVDGLLVRASQRNKVAASSQAFDEMADGVRHAVDFWRVCFSDDTDVSRADGWYFERWMRRGEDKVVTSEITRGREGNLGRWGGWVTSELRNRFAS
jgi:hypothetical protein